MDTCILFLVTLFSTGTKTVLYSDTKTVEALAYSSMYTIPTSKSLLLCNDDLFASKENSAPALIIWKYSYISVFWPLSLVLYFAANNCKTISSDPLLVTILIPCCAVLLFIDVKEVVKPQFVDGATKDALKKSVKELPLLAVAIGSKLVPSIVPIAFSKSPLVAKSKTLE